MKKISLLFILSFFIFFNTFANEYWSNKKEGPTNIEEAETYIYQKYLDITPSDERAKDLSRFTGIWYTQNLGFVGIYEDSFKSNIFKMLLIKAPFGYGANHVYDRETVYKSHIDHEGTIESTIIKNKYKNGKGEYISHNKYWYIQNDGSYEYKTKSGKIKFLTDDIFVHTVKSENSKDFFYKITPRIKKIFKDIDNSKQISEFQIETGNSGMFIYFDTKINKDFIEDKFYNLNSASVDVGKIYRGIDKVQINGIDYITCYNTGLMYYNTADYDSATDTSGKKPKYISATCEPLKISYSDYVHYKNKQYYFTFGIFITLVILFLFIKSKRNRELYEHNKESKNKFKTYSELKEYRHKIEERESEKQAKKEEQRIKAEQIKYEKEIKAEEAKAKTEEKRLEKEERKKEISNKDDSDDVSLMEKVKRLKRLYDSGTLSKAEFEKAKNKLLK